MAPAKISAKITSGPYGGRTLVLDVEEFQPYEPSAYAWDAGYNCAIEIDGEVVWFFVSLDGEVYDEKNDAVGIAPEWKKASEILEAQMTPACCGDPGDCAGCAMNTQADKRCKGTSMMPCLLPKGHSGEHRLLSYDPLMSVTSRQTL